jgi:hemolysin activation/secretion protein
VEDRFDRELNRNLIGRPEFFALGLASTVQIGQALPALGSSESALLYAATIGRGFKISEDQTLIGTATMAGQYFQGEARRHRLGAQLQYYRPQGPHGLFYASAAGDGLTRPDPADGLLLGGEEGLRGYPLRYQAGTRRALFTVEERFYTELYPWRLFRIGGAVFADAGRAWGGDLASGTNTGTLADIGAGLRIVNARSAFSNVLHVDLAMPLNRTPELKKFQFLVKTKTSF